MIPLIAIGCPPSRRPSRMRASSDGAHRRACQRDNMVQEGCMSTRVHVLSRGDARQLETFRRLAPEGVEVVWVDVTPPLDQQAAQLQDAVAVIAAPPVFPVDLALRCRNLRLIQTVSAGQIRSISPRCKSWASRW